MILLLRLYKLGSPQGSLCSRAVSNNDCITVTVKVLLHERDPYCFTCLHCKNYERSQMLPSLITSLLIQKHTSRDGYAFTGKTLVLL